ncbi:MAG: hypothetical protein LW860_08675, partial [Xanthomonadaceae bacterium]|nr:hypothetical protein [Xanthomonadaceae bacterium]
GIEVRARDIPRRLNPQRSLEQLSGRHFACSAVRSGGDRLPTRISREAILSSAFSMNLSRQYTSEVAPSGLYAPAPATGVRGVGFDRLAFFFLSNDSTTGPDIATLPPMANVLPMPNVVVLATLPPPEAPSAAWVPADLAEHDERSGSRGEGRDYAADPLPKRLPH